jgi:molybdate transport system substrate-binding protein
MGHAKRLAALAAALWLAGCGPGKTDNKAGREAKKPAATPELLVYCGAGIRPPVAELTEIFGKENGCKVVTDYAGSEVLLSRLKLAGRGEVYVPGDKHYIDQASEAGLILSRRSVCYFVPAILVQKGNPKGITGLKDLVKPGVKLGLGDAKACAIGRKSNRIFKKNGISPAELEKSLTFRSLTVNELGMQIHAKSLDAVIVWDAIAKYYQKSGEEVAIPVEQNVISTVEAGVLKFAGHKDLAGRLADFLASDKGRSVFKKHNYRISPPVGRPKE